MKRNQIINRIGDEYNTANIEGGEWSYVQDAGTKAKLVATLGYDPKHFKLDLRFKNENTNTVILIETKQNFVSTDEMQLHEYLNEERALHPNENIICILANTMNDKIRVWKSIIDDEHLLENETVLDNMEHYDRFFIEHKKQNDRERVLKNTYALNETLHKKDIAEKLRSQFVGTSLLYIRKTINNRHITEITDKARKELRDYWNGLSAKQIRSGIEDTLNDLLDDSSNKMLKVQLLEKNILEDQRIKNLTTMDWVSILDEIVGNIYKYIDTNSSEGQDILNLFFIAFNKYTGKADKNQAFTPDHITNFMCRATGVDYTKKLFDGTCGSGAFLVQGMVLELASINRQSFTENEKEELREKVRKENIYGIEIEEKAFGLAVTNMLIHNDGNSNIRQANLFESKAFIKKADPDIILMNPPYNAKPITIPDEYKTGWKKDAKEDPTKGFVFLKFISDTIKELNSDRIKNGKTIKTVKCAILLPVSAAIGASSYISNMKNEILIDNTLDAVFTLPNEIFYPGASASVCCMIFTLGKSHINPDGTTNKTFFGYYKDDGHKKKKNLGRIEQFDEKNHSVWKQIEENWLSLYRNKTVKDGISVMQEVTGNDEWLCEAYMKTDYSKLTKSDFQQTLNNCLTYLIKNKKNDKSTIDTSMWKEFRVGDLFKTLIKGKCGDASSLVEGDDINYIGAKWDNNGVMKSCAKNENSNYISKGNCIAMIGQGEGSSGYAIYLDRDFIGATSLTLGYSDWITINTGLFVSTILCQEYNKYSFGRSWTGNRLKNTIIKLPATPSGAPDWQFMENYINSLPYGSKLNTLK